MRGTVSKTQRRQVAKPGVKKLETQHCNIVQYENLQIF